MKMVKSLREFEYFTVFLKNRNFTSKIKRSKVTDYAALIEPRREKTCLRSFASNKGTDQPAHPRSLISAFVIRFFESTISKLTTSEISNF